MDALSDCETMEEKVTALHAIGYAPSQIDKRLHLDEGTAHDVMVRKWRLWKTGDADNA